MKPFNYTSHGSNKCFSKMTAPPWFSSNWILYHVTCIQNPLCHVSWTGLAHMVTTQPLLELSLCFKMSGGGRQWSVIGGPARCVCVWGGWWWHRVWIFLISFWCLQSMVCRTMSEKPFVSSCVPPASFSTTADVVLFCLVHQWPLLPHTRAHTHTESAPTSHPVAEDHRHIPVAQRKKWKRWQTSRAAQRETHNHFTSHAPSLFPRGLQGGGGFPANLSSSGFHFLPFEKYTRRRHDVGLLRLRGTLVSTQIVPLTFFSSNDCWFINSSFNELRDISCFSSHRMNSVI